MAEQRENHAKNLLTNPNIDIGDVRYSQGYINSLGWVNDNIEALAKEEQEEDIDHEQ
jgi:hypothetical protein